MLLQFLPGLQLHSCIYCDFTVLEIIPVLSRDFGSRVLTVGVNVCLSGVNVLYFSCVLVGVCP